MKKGLGFIITGIVIYILSYPMASYILSADSILLKLIPMVTTEFLAFGSAWIITGLLTMKYKEKFKWYFKLLTIILFTFMLFILGGFIWSLFH